MKDPLTHNLMSHLNLISALSSLHPLSNELTQAINSETITLSFPKAHLLLKAPDIANHAYFINQGFAMTFSYVKGKKHVEKFWHSGHIMIALKSFFEQTPSTEFIQLLSDSTVTCIHHQSVSRLLTGFPESLLLYKKIVHQYHDHFRERIHDLHHLSAAQRYVKLIRTIPKIESFSRQEYIASYLGITPPALSRIKKYKADL